MICLSKRDCKVLLLLLFVVSTLLILYQYHDGTRPEVRKVSEKDFGRPPPAERLIQSGVESGWERNHGEEGRENRSSGSQVEQRMSVKQDSLILSNSELDVLSLSSDLEKRGKWQEEKVEAYCRKYGLTNFTYQFPSDKVSKRRLFRHVIYDDKRKLLFTFVPKVGCTNIRRFLFLLQGIIPLESVHWNRSLREKYLELGVQTHSYLVDTMSDDEKMKRVQTYYKATVVRNPLERLLSAFRDKIEFPSRFDDHGWEVRTQRQILRKFGRQSSNNRPQVTFAQYLQWVIDTNNSQLNEHFAPQIENIYPCRMRHDFYGNFVQLGKDMAAIIRKLHAPSEYYPTTGEHTTTWETGNLLNFYYSQVDRKTKHALFHDFYQELDFYYHLFPWESTSHCKLLETDELIN